MQIEKIKQTTFKYDGSTFTIEELRNKDIIDIAEKAYPKTTILEQVGKNLIPQRSMGNNSALDILLTVKKSLKSWTNVKDAEGEELVCDDAGIMYLHEKLSTKQWNDFYKALKVELDKLMKVRKIQKEKTAKN